LDQGFEIGFDSFAEGRGLDDVVDGAGGDLEALGEFATGEAAVGLKEEECGEEAIGAHE
jgi:hypothetical protein